MTERMWEGSAFPAWMQKLLHRSLTSLLPFLLIALISAKQDTIPNGTVFICSSTEMLRKDGSSYRYERTPLMLSSYQYLRREARRYRRSKSDPVMIWKIMKNSEP